MKCTMVDCINEIQKGHNFCDRHLRKRIMTPYGRMSIKNLEKLDIDTLTHMLSNIDKLSPKEIYKRYKLKALIEHEQAGSADENSIISEKQVTAKESPD